MRNTVTGAIMTVLISAAVGVWLYSTRTTGETASNAAAIRTPDGKPSLNGIWQAVNTANWNLEDHAAYGGIGSIGVFGATPPGQGVVEGGEIPYKPEAARKKQQNFEQRYTTDPEAKCFQPGVPRATYMPYPFQIVQGTKKVMIVYGYADANRTIHMDKSNPEPAPIDTWMGRSHGHWEGDTLVVDVAGFNGQAWFDRAGNYASDQLHVVERYTPASPATLLYEATIEDPSVFTRPWKISMPLVRRQEKNAQVLEFKCVEFAEDLLYGHLLKPSARPGRTQ